MARMTLHLPLAAVVLLAATPASAGLFGSKAAAPAAQASRVDDLVRETRRAIDEARYSDAIRLLDRALASGSNDPRFTLLAGDLYLARGADQEALASYNAVAATPSLQAQALAGRGIALSRLGRSGDAIAALRQATTLDASLWRAWNALGVEYDRQKNWTQADAAYGEALKSSAAPAIVHNNRGYSRLLQGRAAEASADFVAALARDPALSIARTNLRLAMAARGEYGRATTASGAEDRAAILNNAGFAALMRGDLPQAEAMLSEAIAVRGKAYGRAQENLQLTRAMITRAQTSTGAAQLP